MRFAVVVDEWKFHLKLFLYLEASPYIIYLVTIQSELQLKMLLIFWLLETDSLLQLPFLECTTAKHTRKNMEVGICFDISYNFLMGVFDRTNEKY